MTLGHLCQWHWGICVNDTGASVSMTLGHLCQWHWGICVNDTGASVSMTLGHMCQWHWGISVNDTGASVSMTLGHLQVQFWLSHDYLATSMVLCLSIHDISMEYMWYESILTDSMQLDHQNPSSYHVSSSPPRTRWPPFRRQYLQTHFHERKFRILIKISLKSIPKGPMDNNSALF